MKSLLECWGPSFLGHSVKLGRFFQILGDQLHDTIPFTYGLSLLPLKHSDGTRVPAGFRYLDAEKGEEKIAPISAEKWAFGSPPWLNIAPMPLVPRGTLS